MIVLFAEASFNKFSLSMKKTRDLASWLLGFLRVNYSQGPGVSGGKTGEVKKMAGGGQLS